MIAPSAKPQQLNGQAGPVTFYRGNAADEGIVISRLMFDGDFARRYAGLIRVGLFHDPAWKRAYGAVQDELEHGEAVDPQAIARALQESLSPEEAHERMADLADYATFEEPSARGALRMLVDRNRSELLADVAGTVAAQVGTAAMNYEQAVELFRAAADTDAAGIGKKLTTLADTLATDPSEDERELIRTGLPWFDDKLPGGGLQQGDLMAVAGPPGVGKTALANQVALAALTNNPDLGVLWCAGEMTQKQIRNRAMSCLSGLPVSILKRPWDQLSPLQEQAKRAAIEALQDIGRRFTFVMAPLTPQAVEAGILATGARLIVIDYLQLMRLETTGSSRRDDIDSILRELVRMGQSHGVATIMISDMPKGPTVGRSIFDSFKETGEIPYAADLAYVGEIGDGHADTDADDLPDEIEVRWRCLKARHGSPRSIITRFQRFRQQFQGVDS